MSFFTRIALVSRLLAASSLLTPAFAQDASLQNSSGATQSPPPDSPSALPEPPGGKRILGVLPNYRTADSSLEATVLTPRQKLTIASKDSFDYPLAGLVPWAETNS